MKFLLSTLLLFLLSCNTPQVPDSPVCQHLSSSLQIEPDTGHLVLRPSPSCMEQIGEPECGHCAWILSKKEVFVGEGKDHWFNGKPWSQVRASAILLPVRESAAPIWTYIVNSCEKMGCNDAVTRFKVKINSFNGMQDALKNQ